MNIEDQITALLAEADPLRCLPEQEQGPLGVIVDKINRLRALQSATTAMLGDAVDEKHEAELAAVIAEVNPEKRKPGRPRKVEA